MNILIKEKRKAVLIGFALFNVFFCFAQKIAIRMDMVHNNPGEPLYESEFNKPEVLKSMGYNSKCYFLFDSPTLAISWDKFDKDILPPGTPDREWVDRKAARLHALFNGCKKEGLDIYAMSDLILLPKRLVSKYHIEKTFGNPLDTLTQRILRYQLHEFFTEFPQMDGIVVRIGETYLEDAPYHIGNIQNKADADKCIIPLINLLREEVCVKLNKKVIFRTWWAFDTDEKKYEYISSRVEPHKNLVIAIKHCEGDFHRGHAFSKVLGMGRHQQLVEVQCAREYEGKGAFPNYIARGVLDGFEENQSRRDEGKMWNLRQEYQTGKMVGLWTWTRGGGWEGPYIKDELWTELNAWVLMQWANNPKASEASLFDRYCKEKLHLDAANAKIFREIALLSEKATLLGLSSRKYPEEVSGIWVRDEYITFPDMPNDKQKVAVMLKEKDEAVEAWNKIAELGAKIKMQNEYQTELVKVTCEYGRQMYKVFRDVFHLSAIKKGLCGEDKSNYIKEYDQSWKTLNNLLITYPRTCPSLYLKTIIRRTRPVAADEAINEMR